jgi:hypothetical protein
MKKSLWVSALVGFLLLVSLAPLQAQTTATPASKITWDQQANSLSEAQGMTYKSYADGSTTGVILTGVTCATGVTSPLYVCSASYPPFTPGAHAIVLTAASTATSTDESPKSTPPMSFTFIVQKAAPANVR